MRWERSLNDCSFYIYFVRFLAKRFFGKIVRSIKIFFSFLSVFEKIVRLVKKYSVLKIFQIVCSFLLTIQVFFLFLNHTIVHEKFSLFLKMSFVGKKSIHISTVITIASISPQTKYKMFSLIRQKCFKFLIWNQINIRFSNKT